MYAEGSPFLTPIELNEYESYLVGLWHEAGTVGQGGMGLAPLTWQEIVAWSDRFFTEESVEWVQSPSRRWMPLLLYVPTLSDWELQTIRAMSQEYCAEASENSPSRPCPKEVVIEHVSKEDAYSESMKLKEALLEMFGKKE